MQRCLCSVLVIAGLFSVLTAARGADDEKFTPLFNGKDLTGWKIVNVAPETFTVKEGILVSTGKPTGTIRTDRMYENFVLELEWRHMVAGGNAGVFIWGDPLTQGNRVLNALFSSLFDATHHDLALDLRMLAAF